MIGFYFAVAYIVQSEISFFSYFCGNLYVTFLA